MQIERATRRAQQVNLTPLIDVVFLLIVFFMLSSSFVISESMELNLPSGKKAAQPIKDVVSIITQADGRVMVGDEALEVNDLDRLLREKIAANPDQKFLLRSVKGVSVQQLVTVLDLIYIHGGRNVQIDQYRPEETTQKPQEEQVSQ